MSGLSIIDRSVENVPFYLREDHEEKREVTIEAEVRLAMNLFDDLEAMVRVFGRNVALAKAIESPNSEETLASKIAIVGFSYHAKTEEWRQGHFEFLQARLKTRWKDDDILEYGPNGRNLPIFFSLCLGYLLGLHQTRRISDKEFALAEVQLYGIIMQHLGQITEHPLTESPGTS